MKKLLANTRRQVASAKGFTLVELLVVVVILGILAAIAIPTLLGQRGKAQDASAKSSVRSSLDTLISIRGDASGQWDVAGVSSSTADILTTLAGGSTPMEGAYTFQDAGSTPSTGPTIVGVDWVSATQVMLSAKSTNATTTYFCIAANAIVATGYGKAATYAACKTAAQSNTGW